MLRKYDELRQAVARIDFNELDDESVRQVQLWGDVADHLRLAIERADETKAEAARVRAEVAEEIREAWDKDGGRLTDKAVESRVSTDKRVQEAEADATEARVAMRKWSDLQEQLRQRDHSLNRLGQLYVGGYFSAVSKNHGGIRELKNRKAEDNRGRIAEKRSARLKLSNVDKGDD